MLRARRFIGRSSSQSLVFESGTGYRLRGPPRPSTSRSAFQSSAQTLDMRIERRLETGHEPTHHASERTGEHLLHIDGRDPSGLTERERPSAGHEPERHATTPDHPVWRFELDDVDRDGRRGEAGVNLDSPAAAGIGESAPCAAGLEPKARIAPDPTSDGQEGLAEPLRVKFGS